MMHFRVESKPYYEQHGFVMIKDGDCGAGLGAVMQDQRAVLPAPEQRIAMVRRLPSAAT